MDERSPQKTKEIHLTYWNIMLGVNNYEPRLHAFSQDRWALINLRGKHSKGKEKGKGDRRENEEGARGRRGGSYCFSIFLRSDSNRKNRDWLAIIKFVSINTNLLRLNSTSLWSSHLNNLRKGRQLRLFDLIQKVWIEIRDYATVFYFPFTHVANKLWRIFDLFLTDSSHIC